MYNEYKKFHFCRCRSAVCIASILSLLILLGGCGGKHGFCVSDVTIIQWDQIYYNQYNTESFEIQINDLDMIYSDVGKAYTGVLGEYVGEISYPGHGIYPVYLPEGAEDCLTLILTEDGQNKIYHLSTANSMQEGKTFLDLLDIYGYADSGGIDRISFSFPQKGMDAPTETGVIVDKKEIKTLIAEFSVLSTCTTEQYNRDCAVTGTADHLEGAVEPSDGKLRSRVIRISGPGRETVKLIFDPVSGYVEGILGLFKVDDALKEKLILLADINMDESYYFEYSEKSAAVRAGWAKIRNTFGNEAKGIEDGGFYGGCYFDGTELVVCMTKDTKENRLLIEEAAGMSTITYKKVSHTYSELFSCRELITKDMNNDRLPFVFSNMINEKENRVSVDITEVKQEYLDILSAYDPSGQWMKIVHVSDIAEQLYP